MFSGEEIKLISDPNLGTARDGINWMLKTVLTRYLLN